MSLEIELVAVDVEDKNIVVGLFQFYLYEMSDFLGLSPLHKGSFDFPGYVLDEYWEADDHYPFFILCDGELAGFCLLRKYPADKSFFDIGQFFVLRKHKGKGVGRKAFELSVSMFPGQWVTRVLIENTGALCFWRSVIGTATGNHFILNKELDRDKEMHFFRYTISGKQ